MGLVGIGNLLTNVLQLVAYVYPCPYVISLRDVDRIPDVSIDHELILVHTGPIFHFTGILCQSYSCVP